MPASELLCFAYFFKILLIFMDLSDTVFNFNHCFSPESVSEEFPKIFSKINQIVLSRI